MRPLPTIPEPLPGTRGERSGSVLPQTIDLTPTSHSGGNQRRGNATGQAAYPWLLLASTLLAGVFCVLYLTKPVIATETVQIPTPQAAPKEPAPPAETPETRADPESPAAVPPGALAAAPANPFEETNLRIQHVLAANGPQGEDLGRLTLDVPVLYASGSIRWTQADVDLARDLLTRIRTYQSRSLELREEAVKLISEWDALMLRSIPEPALRADSPTLPENQGTGTADAAELKSTESIEIENR
ncbi:MAG: hypothetical protein MUF31_13110 [Akkermansiaceae bacterium]|jgi:hypothetical protein|nr:hypothetical protein [Akkermansiaceae bacterium]